MTSDDRRPFYISTAIPFVNAPPHIGFAFEALLADVQARYHRLRGAAVRFQSGTDDNSLKNVRAAERAGLAPEALVRENAARFQALAGTLQLSYDDFVRTSVDPRHRAGTAALWRACARAGDLYRGRYRGVYCVGCEAFLAAADLDDGRCPEHGTAPEPVEEDNWFFRLSRHQAALTRLVETGQVHIRPASRRNEVLAFLGSGLADISVSRSHARARGWGRPVPEDPGQVVYVWFDALGNYIHGLDWAGGGADYRRFWDGPGQRVHVIGKGIVRFHAVYWLAILLSAGLPLPTDLVVHGHLTVDGRKIGKSLGNAIDPQELVARHGAEAVRHYLLRRIRPFEDSDFSETRLRAAARTDLADQLGNLLRRTTTLVQRSFAGRAPHPGSHDPLDQHLRGSLAALPARLHTALEVFAPDEALAAVFDAVAATNRYLEDAAPWRSLSGGDHTRAGTVLAHALEAIRITASALAPFLPATSAAILAQLGHRPAVAGAWDASLGWQGAAWDRPVPGGPVLFAREVPTG